MTYGLVELVLLVLAAVALGGVFVLLAVSLGGLLVFKTKRESHEPLFSMGKPAGGAFVLDDFPEEPEGRRQRIPNEPRRERDEATRIMEEQTNKFLEQLMFNGVKEKTGEKEKMS